MLTFLYYLSSTRSRVSFYEFSGNVYIYHAGRWGAVCDDSWDNQAATVVCKKYNKTGIATVGSKYGNATGMYNFYL